MFWSPASQWHHTQNNLKEKKHSTSSPLLSSSPYLSSISFSHTLQNSNSLALWKKKKKAKTNQANASSRWLVAGVTSRLLNACHLERASLPLCLASIQLLPDSQLRVCLLIPCLGLLISFFSLACLSLNLVKHYSGCISFTYQCSARKDHTGLSYGCCYHFQPNKYKDSIEILRAEKLCCATLGRQLVESWEGAFPIGTIFSPHHPPKKKMLINWEAWEPFLYIR